MHDSYSLYIYIENYAPLASARETSVNNKSVSNSMLYQNKSFLLELGNQSDKLALVRAHHFLNFFAVSVEMKSRHGADTASCGVAKESANYKRLALCGTRYITTKWRGTV